MAARETIAEAYAPKWSNLRAIGNSSAVRMTILIPLIGYFILFNNTLFQSLDLLPELQQWIKPRARLFVFYYGLCALAVGSAIYSYFCPIEIKRYESSTAYVVADMDALGRGGLKNIETLLKGVEGLSRKVEIADAKERLSEAQISGRFESERRAELHKVLLHSHYQVLDSTFPKARVMAVLMYGLGFLLLGVSAFEVFGRVTWTIFRVGIAH